MPPARDSEAPVPVEVSASGAAARFDGNHTKDIYSWLYPTSGYDPELVPAALDQLMEWTVGGHLAWVMFLPGYRIA